MDKVTIIWEKSLPVTQPGRGAAPPLCDLSLCSQCESITTIWVPICKHLKNKAAPKYWKHFFKEFSAKLQGADHQINSRMVMCVYAVFKPQKIASEVHSSALAWVLFWEPQLWRACPSTGLLEVLPRHCSCGQDLFQEIFIWQPLLMLLSKSIQILHFKESISRFTML